MIPNSKNRANKNYLKVPEFAEKIKLPTKTTHHANVSFIRNEFEQTKLFRFFTFFHCKFTNFKQICS